MKVLNIATAVQRRPRPNRAAQDRSEPAVVIDFLARRTDRALVVLSENDWQDWPSDECSRT
jgi:hypothetical protein